MMRQRQHCWYNESPRTAATTRCTLPKRPLRTQTVTRRRRVISSPPLLQRRRWQPRELGAMLVGGRLAAGLQVDALGCLAERSQDGTLTRALLVQVPPASLSPVPPRAGSPASLSPTPLHERHVPHAQPRGGLHATPRWLCMEGWCGGATRRGRGVPKQHQGPPGSRARLSSATAARCHMRIT